MLNRVQNSVVFCFRTDQMLSARGATASKPKDRKIIRFRPPAGKNQLVRFCAQRIRESIARVVNRGARFSSSSMNARGIAKFLSQKRQHGGAGGLAQRRGRVVIEINHPLKLRLVCPRRRGRFCTICNWVSRSEERRVGKECRYR